MVDKYYKDFGLNNKLPKDELEKQELYLLYKRPKKDKGKNKSHYNTVYSENYEHFADLLFLPTDDGYKYALVVTDIGTKKSDAEPLKTKNPEEVAKAFETIYDRDILDYPELVQTDSGTEFKGAVKKLFEKHKIAMRTGKPGRSRQLAPVERTNQYIGNILLKRQQAQELLTGEKSTEWIDDLPDAIEAINKKRGQEPPKPSFNSFQCEGDTCNLLRIGTKVRPKLDHPIDPVTGRQLPGNFRGADIKFEPMVRIVKNIMLLPDQPPLYQLNDIKNPEKIDQTVAYTKNQLQVVPKGERPPPTSVIRGKPNTYVVKKLHDKKKIKNQIHYLVEWKGYPDKKDFTWEKRANLLEDVPLEVYTFEKKLKNNL